MHTETHTKSDKEGKKTMRKCLIQIQIKRNRSIYLMRSMTAACYTHWYRCPFKMN